MRIKMLPSLVLRLVVGSFMVAHSVGMLWAYDAFVKELSGYVVTNAFLDNEFFVLGASLTPFIEFAIGLLLLLGVYFKRAVVICSILLFIHLLLDFSKTSITHHLMIITSFVMTLYMMFLIFIKQKETAKPFSQL